MAKQLGKTKASVETSKNSSAGFLDKYLPKGNGEMLFDTTNYILMVVGALMIIAGFAFMVGGASKDPNVFDADAVYSFQRITLAPALVVGGFIVEIIAIMKRPGNGN